MEQSVIPVFTSQYSGKSILTFDPPEKAKEKHKQSIVDICVENEIAEPFIIENTLSGFMEMYENCRGSGIKPRFGWEFHYRNSDEEDTQKLVAFCKNKDAFSRLVKLHNNANKKNNGVVDKELISEFWDDDLLKLCVPFYDSFVFNNLLTGKNCFPPPANIEKTYLYEDNKLPFDQVIQHALEDKSTIKIKRIFYKKREHFPIWLTYRCALNLLSGGKRRSLETPNFDHCASDEFCFESYLELCQ